MDNSLLAGKYVNKLLSDDAELVEKLKGRKIFPLVCPANVNYPYVVYGRDAIVPVRNKDGVVNATTYVIIAVSDNYSEVLEIANHVRNLLDGKVYRDGDFIIRRIVFKSALEAYNETENAYQERLSFEFVIN